VVLRRYTDPAWREEGLRAAAESLRGLLTAAEPGSDAQLAYAQVFAGVAVTGSDLGLLAGLLDGSADMPGLAVDTELRWALLHRLVARGAAGEPDIERELARDSTDAGERHAAACRAAIPTPAAKEAAWRQIVAGDLPNATFRAVLGGFADPDRPDLMAPYHQRYFEVITGIWERWSPDMAQWFAANAYPMADSRQVIGATDELIARTSPPPPLRRLLAEGRDGVERALRCQQRDRQASEPQRS
jgi:aminopeptidase N